jgi:hypothetical protein
MCHYQREECKPDDLLNLPDDNIRAVRATPLPFNADAEEHPGSGIESRPHKP